VLSVPAGWEGHPQIDLDAINRILIDAPDSRNMESVMPSVPLKLIPSGVMPDAPLKVNISMFFSIMAGGHDNRDIFVTHRRARLLVTR